MRPPSCSAGNCSASASEITEPHQGNASAFCAMATLSHVMHPGVAARLLSVLAYGLTVVPLYRATTRLSHWTMGLCALVLYAHNYTLFHSTMGGYPRSFGPALVLLVIDAWTARKHWHALLWLVLMGGLYPSVLPPTGLAYGVACGAESTQHFGAGTVDRNQVERLLGEVSVHDLEVPAEV